MPGNAINDPGFQTTRWSLVALCLVAETDSDIERLVAYVQDDVSKKRIRAELAMRLFFGSEPAAQSAFDLDRPLRKYSLICFADS